MTKATGKARHPHDSNRPNPIAIRRALEKGDMKALGLALTVRQRRFAQEYILDFNGAAATIRAGYSPKWADRQAHILLAHEGVARYIDHLAQEAAGSIVSVDRDYVVQRVVGIVNKDGAKDGDRLRGLELLARYLGMFIDRTEITGKDGGPIETQKIEEEATAFTNLLKALGERADNLKDDKVTVEIV